MIIPKQVSQIVDKLKSKGFEAFVVGGCVRDLLIEKEPEDWDIATNAKPEQVGKIFSKSFCNNKFGTVIVLTDSTDVRLKEIEITSYRIDEKYSDKRHPDIIRFAKTIEQDLGRRDFTINAMALGEDKIIDPFKGQKDLEKGVIRAVGDPEQRFNEDALRIMRAVRLAAVFNFKIETKTKKAIIKNAGWLQAISKERIRDEFLKIIMSDQPGKGVELMRELNLLKYILPELLENYKVGQNKHHIYDCYEHALKSLEYGADKKFNKYVRLSALFHDIGKPRVKQGKGLNSTFYNHEIVSAKMTFQILNRLKFSKKDIRKITKLVRYHLFYYNVGEVSDSSVRRLVRKAGLENMDELLEIRMCDRIGSGVPKAEPYKLRHLRYLIEKVSQDAVSAGMLKVKGDYIMEALKIKPGPKVGQILDVLLGYVIEDSKKNTEKFLKQEIKKISKLTDKEIENLAQKARNKREKIETKNDEMAKKKYWVS